MENLTFKRWSNKSYAIFASIKANVRIGVVALGCTILTMNTQTAKAKTQANDSLKSVSLDEFAIEAEQIDMHTNLTQLVTTLTTQDIAQSSSSSLSDVLRNMPGVDIRQRGANSIQADLSIRGGSFDQNQVLINGINFSDPQTGHYSLDIPLDLSNIEKIEILQGPSSAALGANAFSGAINVITGKSKEPNFKATAELGSYGHIKANALGKFNIKSTQIMGAYNYNQSSGYIDNTDYKLHNAFLQVYDDSTALGTINFQAGFQDKKFGANSFYSLAYPNQYEETKTFLASLSADKKLGNFDISYKMYWREHLDKFALFRDTLTAPTWYKGHNYHQTDIAGAEISASYRYRIGKTSIGANNRFENILSNVLGDSIAQPIDIWFADKPTQFIYQKMRHNINVFLNQTFMVKSFVISAAGAMNYNNDYNCNFTGGVNMSYTFKHNISLYASANNAIRIPTFTDLYYKSKIQIANPNLKPEKAFTAEIGAQLVDLPLLGGYLNSKIAGFYRYGKDIIDWVKPYNSEVWYSMNHTEINTFGGEAQISYDSYNWIKKLNLNYSYIYMDKQSGEYISKYALDYLQHKVALNFTHKIYAGFEASWQVSYNQRNGEYTNAEGNVVKYDPFFLANLKVSWNKETTGFVKKVHIFVAADNFTNTQYYDYGGILQPGVWIRSGITVNF